MLKLACKAKQMNELQKTEQILKALKARRQLAQSGLIPDKDFIHHEPMPLVWKKLPIKERLKLKAAYPVAILTGSLTKDLIRYKWLNLAFVAVSLVPGPGGFLFLPALLASYAVRTDKNATHTRLKFWNYIKDGVPLSRYREFIRPHSYKKDRYMVDSKALIKFKLLTIKQSTINVNSTAARTVPRLYNKYLSQPFNRAAKKMECPLAKIIGAKRAIAISEGAIRRKESAEKSIKNKFNRAVSGLEKLSNRAGSSLKDQFQALQNCGDEISDKIYYGFAYNLHAAKGLLGMNKAR
jgi:hypothetical protein